MIVKKALADTVFILPIESESKTASGIIIPDAAKERPQRGTVVAAGPGKDGAMTVKEGDVIIHSKHAGLETEIDGKKYLIMRESDIFAIL